MSSNTPGSVPGDTDQDEINHLISSILSKLRMSSINSLINNEEDEDRKFLRAATEAIVATSMNNSIDPTILELLRRIQYANSPGGNNNTPVNNGSNGISPNEPEHILTNHSLTQSRNVTDINFLDTSSNVNPAKNSSHFPTFNLSYFDNLQQQQQELRLQQQQHASGSEDTTPPSNSDEKPFICKDCSLSFRRSSDLRRHQRAHLPILPHICKMCGKGFARKDALKRHSDTLTCKRNREKLLSSGGDVESILEEAKRQGNDV